MKLISRPEVTALPLTVARQAKIVELLCRYLNGGEPATAHDKDRNITVDPRATFERCWRAMDAFLVGRKQIDEHPPLVLFNRSLRTTNFCIDLYDDFRQNPGHLPVDRYLRTRQALLTADTPSVGRFRLPTTGFVTRLIDLQQKQGGEVLRSVPAMATADPTRVFAYRAIQEISTLFGCVVFAEEVQRTPSSLQPVFVTTGRRVILK